MTPEPDEPTAPLITRTIRLSEDLWRKLRSRAALRGMSATAGAVEAIREWVATDEKPTAPAGEE